jgi:hypothetical protein
MNAHPRTIAIEELAATALAILEERKITLLAATGSEEIVEIESFWTGWRQDHDGTPPGPKIRTLGTQSCEVGEK